jgi:hypothetical protein
VWPRRPGQHCNVTPQSVTAASWTLVAAAAAAVVLQPQPANNQTTDPHKAKKGCDSQHQDEFCSMILFKVVRFAL